MSREIPQYVSQLTMGSMPLVRPTGLQAEAQSLGKASQQAIYIAEDMNRKSTELEELQAQTTLRTEMSRMYNEAKNDPALLKQKIDGFKTGFVKGIKNAELAQKFEMIYDTTAIPYIDKATDQYNRILDQEREVAALTHIESSISGVKDLADGLVSDIPERNMAAHASMSDIINEVSKTVSMRKSDGTFMFTPEQQIAYTKRAQKQIEEQVKTARLRPIENELLQNPQSLIQKIQSGALDSRLNADEKEKYTKEAIAKFKDNEERGQILRVVQSAVSDSEIYQKFVSNSPNILEEIERYKNDGGDPELYDYMRKSALKANPISASEQDVVYSQILDQVNDLGITSKNGKVKIRKDDVKLEDVVRLQQKIMKESVRGVTGLDSQLKRLSPAILEMAKKERGKDDLGVDSFFGFFRETEAYDTGYGTIQKWLEGQDREKDYAAKASMMKDFIDKADRLPDEIKNNEILFEQAQDEIAKSVIARQTKAPMANIPVGAIKKLIANPELAKQFDEKFGVGSADRILGK